MAGGGLVTAVPLLQFAAAASRVSPTTIGNMQHMNPTMQSLPNVVVLREAFPAARLVGFGLVWIALALFWIERIHPRGALASATGPHPEGH